MFVSTLWRRLHQHTSSDTRIFFPIDHYRNLLSCSGFFWRASSVSEVWGFCKACRSNNPAALLRIFLFFFPFACFGEGCLERVLQRSWPPMNQLCHAYWDLIERRNRPRDSNFFTVCVTGGFVSEKELWRISPRDFAANPSSLIECEEVRIIRYVLRFSLCRFKSWLDSEFFLSFLFPLPLDIKDSWASAWKKEKKNPSCVLRWCNRRRILEDVVFSTRINPGLNFGFCPQHRWGVGR